MEQLQAFWDMLCGPWGPVVGFLSYAIGVRLGISLPKNPLSKPTTPTLPTPTLPILFPNEDGSPKYPILRKLLDSFLSGSGLQLHDVPAPNLKAVKAEIDALLAEKAEKAKAEAADLAT